MVFGASGTFSETKRPAGLLRMLQAGVVVPDTGHRGLRSHRHAVGKARGSDCPDRREVSGLLFGLLAVDDDADHQAAATAATVRASSTLVWIYVVEL